MTSDKSKPAFPSLHSPSRNGMTTDFPGMTLRQYYAIHAPSGELEPYLRKLGKNNYQKARFMYADAMLAEGAQDA